MDEFYKYVSKIASKYLDKGLLLDIGAYQGDFAKEIFKTANFEKALLFEPNPENLKKLEDRFSNNPDFTIIPSAVGNEIGKCAFNYSSDYATGSVLPYVNNEDTQSIEISKIRLDFFLKKGEKVSLIKIDTQGTDLSVLKGAQEIIQENQPIIVTEMIFVPLYKGQENYSEIIGWLLEKEYTLAGIFNQHSTSEGFLAFADGVFIPKKIHNTASVTEFFPVFDENLLARNKLLQHENEQLKLECAKRLDLINNLSLTLKKRFLYKIYFYLKHKLNII